MRQQANERTTESGSMSETGQLQQLTDQQVKARLAAYNPDGSLEGDIAMLRENVADIIAEEITAQFGPERAALYANVYSAKVNADWIQGIAEYGRRIYREKTSVPVYMAARADAAGRIIARMVDRFASEPQKLQECVGAFMRMKTYETDIIL